jgi:ATP-dependent Clp protease adaptor protein ClpS
VGAHQATRESVGTRPAARARTARPRLWRVLLHNDDFTTQDFVTWVLESVFRKSRAEAVEIMMNVHRTGLGLAGVFTHDVAETHVRRTQVLAEVHEFPLLATMEPEPDRDPDVPPSPLP